MPKKRKEAVRELVTALYLYPNYRVDSRGPLGCLMTAIQLLDPKVHRETIESDAHAVYQKRYAEKD